MRWPYTYTPYIWPMLATAALVIVLGAYAWRRRYVAAAAPFVLLTLFWAVWALACALELAAVDQGTKFLWFQVQAFVKLPVISCALVFVLAYAGLDKWINRTTLTLLALPCLVLPVIIVTNSAHHLFWTSVHIAMIAEVALGPAAWAAGAYIYLLFLFQVGVLVWFWFRSPLWRWPVALILGSQLIVRIAGIADLWGINPVAPLDPAALFSSLMAVAYFIALFRFRILDVIPFGREAAFEDMPNGLLILNAENRIADLNPAAQDILALPRASSLGRPAAEALAAYPGILQLLDREGPADAEMTLDPHAPARSFQVHASILTYGHSQGIGRLVWLRDVTEQKRAQARIMEQERALATMAERERLARELHDTLVQATAAIRVEAEVSQQLLTQGETARVQRELERLADSAQEMHFDLREYLFGVSATAAKEQDFFAALRAYLVQFNRRWSIETRLQAPPELEQQGLGPAVEIQLMRIIQEALTNVRKHARARHVEIVFERKGAQTQVTIQDDGCGFDPAQLAVPDARTFGTRSMRERTQAIGGTFAIESTPGHGTRVGILVPGEK